MMRKLFRKADGFLWNLRVRSHRVDRRRRRKVHAIPTPFLWMR